jgi:hypothetical protein
VGYESIMLATGLGLPWDLVLSSWTPQTSHRFKTPQAKTGEENLPGLQGMGQTQAVTLCCSVELQPGGSGPHRFTTSEGPG